MQASSLFGTISALSTRFDLVGSMDCISADNRIYSITSRCLTLMTEFRQQLGALTVSELSLWDGTAGRSIIQSYITEAADGLPVRVEALLPELRETGLTDTVKVYDGMVVLDMAGAESEFVDWEPLIEHLTDELEQLVRRAERFKRRIHADQQECSKTLAAYWGQLVNQLESAIQLISISTDSSPPGTGMSNIRDFIPRTQNYDG